MKFSGKMCLKIIIKVTKIQGFSLSLEDALFQKPQGGGGGQKYPPHPPPRGGGGAQTDPPSPPSRFMVKV